MITIRNAVFFLQIILWIYTFYYVNKKSRSSPLMDRQINSYFFIARNFNLKQFRSVGKKYPYGLKDATGKHHFCSSCEAFDDLIECNRSEDNKDALFCKECFALFVDEK